MLFRDDKIDDAERTLLRELKGEAKETAGEFDKLFQECMKAPQESRTAGGRR